VRERERKRERKRKGGNNENAKKLRKIFGWIRDEGITRISEKDIKNFDFGNFFETCSVLKTKSRAPSTNVCFEIEKRKRKRKKQVKE